MKNKFLIIILSLIFSNSYSQVFTINEIEKIVLSDYDKADVDIQEKGFIFDGSSEVNGIKTYNYKSKNTNQILCGFFQTTDKTNLIYIFKSQETYLSIKKSLNSLNYESMGVVNEDKKTYFVYYKYTGEGYHYSLDLYNNFDGLYAVSLKKIISE